MEGVAGDPGRQGRHERGGVTASYTGKVQGDGCTRQKEESVGRRNKTGKDDRNEGAMDKAKGRMKEAAGALSGDKDKKAEGRADQRSGTAKEKKGHLKDLLK